MICNTSEIKKLLNVDSKQLAEMRNKNQIEFTKVGPKSFSYNINEELIKDFLPGANFDKKLSTTSAEYDVEMILADENIQFPEFRGTYYTDSKRQKKLNSFVQRDYLIRTYRKLAERPEVINSIDEIINEALTPFETGEIVKIDFSSNDDDIGQETKKEISESFDKAKDLLDFDNNAYYLFKDWYIDGFKALECIYDNDKLEDGIKHLVSLSPFYFREYKEKGTGKKLYNFDMSASFSYADNVQKKSLVNPYTEEQIINVGSGEYDVDKVYEISYLHYAMKAINDLAHIENSIVKYRITRASEKNIWNIDVGLMPKQKAEQHLTALSTKISSNINYNTETGQTNLDATEGITDDWLFPSRNGKNKTEVQTINGNSDFISKLEDLNYFRRKMYEAMKISIGRLDGDSSLDYSSMDILREELKFTKFVQRLRRQFQNIFLEFIRRDLVARKKLSEDEWIKIKKFVVIKWNQSNPIVENAELENMKKRFEMISELEQNNIIGKYVPINFLIDKILKMTEEEFLEYQKEIQKEEAQGWYKKFNKTTDE